MTLLDRYLARRLVATLFKIMLTLVMLFILVDLLTHRQDNIVDYGIPLPIVATYYLTFVPTVLFKYQAAALAVLVGGLMVLGRAAQDNEVTAALAGGISFHRLARTPLIIALLLAVAAYWVQETLGTRATVKATEIERKYFSRFAEDDHSGVSWTNLSGGWTCHILKFNRAALTGEDVILHRLEPDLEMDIIAQRIYWDDSRSAWMVENGVQRAFYPQRGMERTTVRVTQQMAPFQETPEVLFSLEQPPDTKTAAQLRQDLHRAESLGLGTGRYWVEYHVKFAQPALCFIMMLIALPFAMRLRRGGLAIGFGLSVLIGTAYVLVFYASLGLGYLNLLPPAVAAWSANALFLGIGAVLYARIPT